MSYSSPSKLSTLPIPVVLPSTSSKKLSKMVTEGNESSSSSSVVKSLYGLPGGLPVPPITCPPPSELNRLFPGPEEKRKERDGGRDGKMLLELVDGTAFEGFGFGTDINVSGECVFTTGTSLSISR